MAADDQVAAFAQQFVTTYYTTFDSNRVGLAALYLPQSKLIFEGTTFSGPEAISKKITELPFQTIAHEITSVDSCVTIDEGICVMVVGRLKTDNDPPHGFVQSFYLKQVQGNVFVLNDIFRLVLHHSA